MNYKHNNMKQNRMLMRAEQKPWIIEPKDIYGLYQEDIINVGYKWVSSSC